MSWDQGKKHVESVCVCVCPCAHVHVCLRVCCVCVCTHVCVRVCMWARAIFCSIKKRAGGEVRLEISSEAFEKTICRAPTRAPSTRRPAPLAATGPVRRVVLQITIGLRAYTAPWPRPAFLARRRRAGRTCSPRDEPSLCLARQDSLRAARSPPGGAY